jgi:hypothetical protein
VRSHTSYRKGVVRSRGNAKHKTSSDCLPGVDLFGELRGLALDLPSRSSATTLVAESVLDRSGVSDEDCLPCCALFVSVNANVL